jgi:hypothetical protein
MRKIAILCPSYDGKVVCDQTLNLVSIFAKASKERPELNITLNYWMYEAVIQKARNNLFCDAYESGADDIVFMDVDQCVDPQAFFDLIDHPVDVVGITARMKTDEERYNHRPENDLDHKLDTNLKLLHVQYLPTGYLRLSRKAMTALYDNSPMYWDNHQQRKLICNVTIEENGLISEDIHMCTKLNNLGFKCYLDFKYTCDHFGIKRYMGDYQNQYFTNVIKHCAKL